MLTSSHRSSQTVFVFTSALFLSGYAIQQRTLHELRAAVKPSPRPEAKLFLPDRFKRSTTELEDGTVIALDADLEDDYFAGIVRPQKTPSQQEMKTDEVVLEVQPFVPEESLPGSEGQIPEDATDKVDTPTRQEEKQSFWSFGRKGEPATKEKDPKKDKPISAAERRRRIKEDIKQLSQGQERGYYQRRLW